MEYQAMTNSAIAAEIGKRLEQRRLERNMTQRQLAEEIGITPKSYRQLAAGNGKLENLIAALRALDALQQLDNLLPAAPPSPLAQLRQRGKERQRARRKNPAETAGQPQDGLDW